MSIIDALPLRATTSAQHPAGRHAAGEDSAAGFGAAMDRARAADGPLRPGETPVATDTPDQPAGAAVDRQDAADQTAVAETAGSATPDLSRYAAGAGSAPQDTAAQTSSAPAMDVQTPGAQAPDTQTPEAQTPDAQTPSALTSGAQLSAVPTMSIAKSAPSATDGGESQSAALTQAESMSPAPLPAPAAEAAETSVEPNRPFAARQGPVAPAGPVAASAPDITAAEGTVQAAIAPATNSPGRTDVTATHAAAQTTAPGRVPMTGIPAKSIPTSISQTGAPVAVTPPLTITTATGAPITAATPGVRAGADPAATPADAAIPASVPAPVLGTQIAQVAPSAPATPALPVHPTPLASQIARPLFTLATAGAGEHIMTINVTPENLGPVTVRAHIGGEGIRLEVFAPTDIARDALRAILPDLKRDLAGSGMNANLSLSPQNQPGDSRGMAGGGAHPGANGGDWQRPSGETSPGERPAARPPARHVAAPNAPGTTIHIDVMA